MRNILIGSILMALALGMGTSPAWADLDQHCLSLCMNNGGTSSNCLPECSYNEPAHTKPYSANSALSSHDVFDAPVPIGSIILSQPHKTAAAPDKDYVCVNQCLHEGGQFDRCNKSCTKTDCQTATSGCTGLMGNLPASPTGQPAAPPASR